MSTRIHPAALVDPGAQLGTDVEVGPGTVVGPHARIGDRTRIGSCALITGWARIGSDCKLHHGAVVGSPPQDLKYPGEESYLEIGDRTEVREFVTANLATEPGATTRIGSECLLMAYSHVAHDCQLGSHVVVANSVQFAGYVTVEDWAIVGGGSLIHQFVRIGCHAMIGGGSRIPQDVAPYITLAGSPPRLAGINVIGLERRGFGKETVDALNGAYRVLFREGLNLGEAVSALRDRYAAHPEVEHLARFAETSTRGLTR
ncbi:MAG TPA: acyl-ACP--UDP-N-acetylglucosamine O-acyltransferase [Candidatus Sulfotelmatobacter sp.]|nr:acyl-ACP--UDP-N-acetylglucosamine O-acyltransferase [Candidatus Sulfotelmatobacter sp.]